MTFLGETMTVTELKALKKQLQRPLPLLQQVDEWVEEGNDQDLNDVLGVRDKSHSFFYAADDCMAYRGLSAGDLVVVDHAQRAKQGDVVVAQVDEGLLCRELDLAEQTLVGECLDPIAMDEYACCRVLGVVCATIRQF